MNARATQRPSGRTRRGPTAAISPRCEAEALLELGVKAASGSATMRSASCASSVHTIDERWPPRRRFQRQDRERTRREEMLLGAPVMIALVRHRGDDGGLAVAPAVAGDACALANRRTRAVGGDQKPRRDRSAIRELTSMRVTIPAREPSPTLCGDGEMSATADRRSATPSCLPLHQRRDQRRVLDHVGERLARLDLAVEGEESRPHRVVQPAVGDHHVENRLRLRPASQTPIVSNSRRAAATIAEARPSSDARPAPDRRP